ncbi:unnamed protein product [Clavelina lepadiformis]|uniref:GT23 domain-containing protein n=1 Tax=Clavelina lepadiformis TaxID=159417 RepID=A0ABP0FW09_CLALP
MFTLNQHMSKKRLKFFLAFTLGLNAILLYKVATQSVDSEKRLQNCHSECLYLSESRRIDQRNLEELICARHNKDQFIFRGTRNLIKGAYSEALHLKDFAKKYFRKDLDQTTKAALEEDYSRNYLPFKDLTWKIESLVDNIHRESRKQLTILGDQVQERIRKLQNPSDCKTAKKLICKFPYCGLGCQLHHIGNCLLVALGTNRVMLVNYKKVRYPGFEKVFLPLSETCSNEDLPVLTVEWLGELQKNYDNIPVISLNQEPAKDETLFRAFTIPKSLQESVEVLHDDPHLWWVGQIMRYVFRLRPWIVGKVEQITEKLNLTQPYVSVHVRRTDKLVEEARKCEIEEYMEHVIDWYDRHVGSVEGGRVYVASDDLASVIPEARSKYPRFTFLYHAEDKKPLKDMTQTVKGRETEEELVSLVCDLMILSRSDYFIGTYSSNIGRLVVQLMHSVDDATFKTRSVDQQMSFQLGIPLYYRSIEAHFGQEGELSFNAGERIVLQPFVESPAYKGFGTNRAGHYGSFPMYKVEKILPPVPYLALSNKV